MEGQDNEQKVLNALDTAWQKFGIFVKSLFEELKLQGTEVAEAREIFEFDVILFLPKIRSFIEKHKVALGEKDVQYFRDLCPPRFAELKTLELTESQLAKAFLFGRVFQSLLDDLAHNE